MKGFKTLCTRMSVTRLNKSSGLLLLIRNMKQRIIKSAYIIIRDIFCIALFSIKEGTHTGTKNIQNEIKYLFGNIYLENLGERFLCLELIFCRYR